MIRVILCFLWRRVILCFLFDHIKSDCQKDGSANHSWSYSAYCKHHVGRHSNQWCAELCHGFLCQWCFKWHALRSKISPKFWDRYVSSKVDPSLMELLSMRDAINSMNDPNMESNQSNYVATSNLNLDNSHVNLGCGADGMPTTSQTNIDYYNQNFGPFPNSLA